MIRPIAAADVRPLRQQLLRPGVPLDRLVYPGDDGPDALHAGAFSLDADGGERLVGIASVFPQAPPDKLRDEMPEDAWTPGQSFRLRGMATDPEVRGSGLGRGLIEACFEHLRDRGATYLWCDARVGAVGFYQAMGLTAVGDEYDVPDVGPHYTMWRAV